jgi:hypothetical protein
MNRRAVTFASLCLLVATSPSGRAVETYPDKAAMIKMYSFHQEARANKEYDKEETTIELKPQGAPTGIIEPGNVVIGFRCPPQGELKQIFRGKVDSLMSGGGVVVERGTGLRYSIRTEDIFLIQVKKAEPPPPPPGFTFTDENWTLFREDEAGIGKMQAISENRLKIEAPPGRFVRSFNRNCLEGDFTASVMVAKVGKDSPDEFGMVFVDANAPARDVLRFSLALPGHWRIVRGSGVENEKKAEWKPLPKSTEAQKFQLVVERLGTRYEMRVNDETVGEIDLGVSAIVHPGLFAAAWEPGDERANGVEVEFSDFNVDQGKVAK